jgi:hypothetical protein
LRPRGRGPGGGGARQHRELVLDPFSEPRDLARSHLTRVASRRAPRPSPSGAWNSLSAVQLAIPIALDSQSRSGPSGADAGSAGGHHRDHRSRPPRRHRRSAQRRAGWPSYSQLAKAPADCGPARRKRKHARSSSPSASTRDAPGADRSRGILHRIVGARIPAASASASERRNRRPGPATRPALRAQAVSSRAGSEVGRSLRRWRARRSS